MGNIAVQCLSGIDPACAGHARCFARILSMMPSAAPIDSPKRFVDPSGTAIATLPDFATDPTQLIMLHRAMVLTRAFDAKAIALQRTGRLGTYASSIKAAAPARAPTTVKAPARPSPPGPTALRTWLMPAYRCRYAGGAMRFA
jgi:hypothetical protein